MAHFAAVAAFIVKWFADADPAASSRGINHAQRSGIQFEERKLSSRQFARGPWSQDRAAQPARRSRRQAAVQELQEAQPRRKMSEDAARLRSEIAQLEARYDGRSEE